MLEELEKKGSSCRISRTNYNYLYKKKKKIRKRKKKKVLNLNYLLFHIYYGGSPHVVSHSNSLNQAFIYLTKGDGF